MQLSSASSCDSSGVSGKTVHGTTIPALLHQTYKSCPTSGLYGKSLAQWKTKNPGYAYRFADDDRLRSDMERFCAEAVKSRDGANVARRVMQGFLASTTSIVEKTDIWRYAIVYLEGGMYADMDTLPLRSIDTLVPAELGTSARMIVGWHIPQVELCQWCFAAAPQQDVLYHACVSAAMQSLTMPEEPTMSKTGPLLLTRLMNPILTKAHQHNVILYDKQVFGSHGHSAALKWANRKPDVGGNQSMARIQSRDAPALVQKWTGYNGQGILAGSEFIVHMGTASWRPWNRRPWVTRPLIVLVILIALVIAVVIVSRTYWNRRKRPSESSVVL